MTPDWPCPTCGGSDYVTVVPIAELRDWIETRRGWTKLAGATPSERTIGHLFVLTTLGEFLDEREATDERREQAS